LRRQAAAAQSQEQLDCFDCPSHGAKHHGKCHSLRP
jgi:hypothetical protein